MANCPDESLLHHKLRGLPAWQPAAIGGWLFRSLWLGKLQQHQQQLTV
jgi:hypothetical protein